MKNTVRDSLVGLTVIIGLLGVATLMLMFGEITGRKDRYPFTLVLDQAPGVTTASRVTLNGVVIGVIKAVKLTTDPPAGVEIDLEVNRGVRVPRDAQVLLDRGLVGEATLLFSTAKVKRAPGAPAPGFIAEGERFRADAKGVLDQIAGVLDDRLSAFSEAAGSVKTLSETYTDLGRRAQDLFTPRSSADVDAGRGPANIASTIDRIDKATAAAHDWLGDGALRTDARAAVERFKSLLDQGAAAVESWKLAAETLSKNAQSLGDQGTAAMRDVAAVSQTLGEALAQVREIAGSINRGEGTVGQLVKNPDLYRSMNDAAERLESALTEAQLLIEKYRTEGVPVRF